VDTQGLPPSGLGVEADAHRLARIVSNLLTNAARYSEAGTPAAAGFDRHHGEPVDLAALGAVLAERPGPLPPRPRG